MVGGGDGDGASNGEGDTGDNAGDDGGDTGDAGDGGGDTGNDGGDDGGDGGDTGNDGGDGDGGRGNSSDTDGGRGNSSDTDGDGETVTVKEDFGSGVDPFGSWTWEDWTFHASKHVGKYVLSRYSPGHVGFYDFHRFPIFVCELVVQKRLT